MPSPSSDSEDKPELIVVQNESDGAAQMADDESIESRGIVEEPAKVMRIGTMIKQLLEEVRQAPLDDQSRIRLRHVYDQSVDELAEGLSPDLREELDRLIRPFDDDVVPSDAELRIAQAQLVGWLEGLFHGIQAALFAQQAAAKVQLEELRRRRLPPGEGDQQGGESRPGTYL